MTAVLRADGLSKRFGGLKANDNVSLSLQKGQILGLIGPNGAGKTTCFSMLAGSIPPTSGRVFLEEEEITGRPAFLVARTGVVRTHQIVRPFANLTLLENCTVAAAQCSGKDDAGSRELAKHLFTLPTHSRLAPRDVAALARLLPSGSSSGFPR